MIDESFKVYLIEVNINPCLSVTSSFSSRFIGGLVDNTLRIAVDPLFPPPADFSIKKSSLDILPEIKYELIFDQRVDGPELDKFYANTSICNSPHNL
jgi:tubulin--tyrosine ligase